jgi:hypothetical protein
MRPWSAKRSSASTPADSAALGAVRFDPARARSSRAGHVESWFLKANDPRGRRALLLRWTIWAGDHAPDRALAETWAVAFGAAGGPVATKTSVPFERASFAAGALGAEIDGCRLSPESAHGRVESGGRAIAYDLSFESLDPPIVHLPARWMYSPAFPFQKLASVMPNVRVRGTATVQGEPWALQAWPGMVGHTWGHAHSEPYAWGHCNAWDSADAPDGDVGRGSGPHETVVLEGFTARPSALLPPVTSLSLRVGGEAFPLNGFASLAQNAGSITPRRWSFRAFRAARPRVEVAGEMWADTDDFAGLFFHQPDGSECLCLSSMLARAEITLSIAGRPPRTLRSGRAALELATSDPDHGVRMHV